MLRPESIRFIALVAAVDAPGPRGLVCAKPACAPVP